MSSPALRYAKALSNADLTVVAAIMVLTLVVFGPTARHEFVDYDLLFYAGNPHVQQGLTLQGIRWASTSNIGGNWHPVTMLAHMTVHQFFGPEPAAHHLVNVFLHLANALLVFAVFRRMTGAVWLSGLVALLFSLHPLRVESVVWAAELKDVLSIFWALLALLAYTRFVAKRSAARYTLVAVLFALALMSKASTVTLPFLMLLLDYWPLGRLRAASRPSAGAVLLEKLPLIGLAAGMSAITLLTFHDTMQKFTSVLPLTYRVVMSLQAYLAYLVQTVLPFRLAPHYPYVPLEHPLTYAVLPLIVLGAITAFVLWQRKMRPYLLMGWLWFLAAIAPISGILVVGTAYRADRYTYLAHIGLFVALVWGAADLVRARPRLRRPAQALAAAAVLASAGVSYVNVGYWQDNLMLFSHAVRVVPQSDEMHAGLALTFIQLNQLDRAEKELRTALQIDSDDPDILSNYGVLLMALGRMDEAAEKFELLLAAQPNHARTLYSLSICRAWRGRTAEALELLERAIALDGTLAAEARKDSFFTLISESRKFIELIQ